MLPKFDTSSENNMKMIETQILWRKTTNATKKCNKKMQQKMQQKNVTKKKTYGSIK